MGDNREGGKTTGIRERGEQNSYEREYMKSVIVRELNQNPQTQRMKKIYQQKDNNKSQHTNTQKHKTTSINSSNIIDT